jgi:hypothetical protein
MRTKLTKIVFAASLVLALAFTFSCSSDDDDGGGKGGGTIVSGLETAAGEVWSNGQVGHIIEKGVWYRAITIGGVWEAKTKVGTVSGNKLKPDTDIVQVVPEYTYTLSGNTLTLIVTIDSGETVSADFNKLTGQTIND